MSLCKSRKIIFSFIIFVLVIFFTNFALSQNSTTPQVFDEELYQSKYLIVNGSSLESCLFVNNTSNWFRFSAKEGYFYQFLIQKGLNYTLLMDLFSFWDNRIIRHDYYGMNNTIEWLCPATGDYSFVIYCPQENNYFLKNCYKINILCFDLLEDNPGFSNKIISVPDYLQSNLPEIDNWCAPTAAANIIGYWDDNGFDNLIDNGTSQTGDSISAIMDLGYIMMGYISPYSKNYKSPYSIDDMEVADGIAIFCGGSFYKNNYEFKCDLIYDPNFSTIVKEIDANRPVMCGLSDHLFWKNHWTTIIGYLITDTTRWVIAHDTWKITPQEVYINWDDDATECIIVVHPDETSIPFNSSSTIFNVFKPGIVDKRYPPPSFSYDIKNIFTPRLPEDIFSHFLSPPPFRTKDEIDSFGLPSFSNKNIFTEI